MTDEYSQREAFKWTFDTFEGTSDPHMYFEVAQGEKYAGNPLVFTFPAADGRQDFHYDAASMVVEAQEDSLFALPEGCAGKPCSSKARRHHTSTK
jgi:hypothetical protein